MGLQDYKAKQIGPSQRAGTRARTLIARFWDKVSRCVDRYKAAYSALLSLSEPEGEWRSRLRPLTDKDVRTPRRHDDETRAHANSHGYGGLRVGAGSMGLIPSKS